MSRGGHLNSHRSRRRRQFFLEVCFLGHFHCSYQRTKRQKKKKKKKKKAEKKKTEKKKTEKKTKKKEKKNQTQR